MSSRDYSEKGKRGSVHDVGSVPAERLQCGRERARALANWANGRHRYAGSSLPEAVSRSRVELESHGLTIYPMCRNDLEQVLAIEEASFPSPWSRRNFETELKKDFNVSIVAVVDNRVVGYLIGWFMADEIHVANIAVHPEWRKRGIGELLIHKIVKMGRGHSWIGLEVRRSNRAARSLYSKLGFYKVGVRKNYYAQEGEDAILMVRRLHP